MMNGAWVALVVLACAGLSGGDDVRAGGSGSAVPYQVSAGETSADHEQSKEDAAKARGGQEQEEEGKTGRGQAGRARPGRGRPAPHAQAEDGGALVDVNQASAAQLEALPGVGASAASRIVEYRQKHGPFKRLDDLMNVRGIGEKNFLKLKPLITIGGGKTGQPGTSES